jgi:hypothetical protein
VYSSRIAGIDADRRDQSKTEESGVVADAIVAVVATGAYDAAKAGVKKFVKKDKK